MFVGLRATFLEKEFLREGTEASKVELREVQQVEEPSHSKTTTDLDLIRSNLEPIVIQLEDLVEYHVNRTDTSVSWSGMVILLNSMRIMRI